MTAPLVRLVLSNKKGDGRRGPLKIEASFQTDLGTIRISGTGTLAEICEMVPMQIQNAGSIYGLMHALMEVDAQ